MGMSVGLKDFPLNLHSQNLDFLYLGDIFLTALFVHMHIIERAVIICQVVNLGKIIAIGLCSIDKIF